MAENTALGRMRIDFLMFRTLCMTVAAIVVRTQPDLYETSQAQGRAARAICPLRRTELPATVQVAREGAHPD